MTFEQFFNFPKLPGIYYFRNTKNNKYYIGQAQEIRERVLKHKTNFESGYYPDAHLYRAWRKHGIEIFEIGVLEIVDLPKGEERNKQLDILEKQYIEEFNSYGTGGYNQTRGGDGGIDGYKFTDLQKKRLYINGKFKNLDGSNRLYFYDIKTKQYGETPSFQIINDIFNTNSRYRKSQTCYFGRYILDKTKIELEKKIKKFYSSEYCYSVTDSIDNETIDLQKKINERIEEIRKEIDDFFAKYGKAKYNRKDNKAKKEVLRKLQKADLEAGISKKEYMEKYNIKTTAAFYDHIYKLCPDWVEPGYEHIDMTDEMKEDILNRVCCSKFVRKYNVHEANFYRFKHKIEDELNIKIVSNNPGINCKPVSDEQEQDILNGITVVEYMKKYLLCEETFYEHRKYVSQKHPEYKFKPVRKNQKVDINLIREDIEKGISKLDFCIKYNLSENSYKKYKRVILNEEVDTSYITDEQKEDIRNGMTAKEYREKYNVSRDTFYSHRKLILKPEEITKRQITLNELLSDEQKADLSNGMNVFDYMEKYNVNSKVYYRHRKFVIPDEKERCKNQNVKHQKSRTGLTEEQKQDLLNGMSERDFMLKYRLSRRTYTKYKKKVIQEKEKIREDDKNLSK